MVTLKIFSIIYIIALYPSCIKCQSFAPSALDIFYSKYYTTIRRSMMLGIGRTSENVENMRLAKKLNMLQEEVPPSQPFPCNTTGFRSATRPTSVHQVRPGDIDVVGALGDSLTAGFGLVATNVLQVLMENRGLSWSIGGQGTWRQYITLPNILKEFNPNLIGYSLRDSYSNDRNSQFNPAEGGAISSEMPYMAKVLIKRITSDKRVNLKKDWKLITIIIGVNDFCLDICYQNNLTSFLEEHRKDMITTLRLLRDNLPRTIVNFVVLPRLQGLVELKHVPEHCQQIRLFACHCFLADRNKDKKKIFYRYEEKWRKIDEEISNIPEFHKNDFTVVYQPFFRAYEVPSISKELPDLSFMSNDCLHLSQKINARVANALWNNMIQKVGKKTIEIQPLFDKFVCPTQENPYIFTNGNS